MNFSPELIGVGKYTGELARWLARRGHAVEVVTAWPHYPGFVRQSDPKIDGASSAMLRVFRCPILLGRNGRGVWRLLAPLSFALMAAPVIVWRALRFRPDVILCVEPTLLAAPAAILAARLCGARTALHVQDLEVDAAFALRRIQWPLARTMSFGVERRLLETFNGIVTISDAMAARLAGKGLPRSRIVVVRNWIETIRQTTGASDVRSRFGIGPDETVVLYAGLLGCKQGVPSLLAALHRVAQRRAVRIVIAGDGPLATLVDAARATLPGLLALPVQDKSTYDLLLGTADIHLLPQVAGAADLVFPSKLGPILATGRPVVVTAEPHTELAQWLAGAAVVVPPGDPAALADGIERALDLPPSTFANQALQLAGTLRAELLLPAFEAALMRIATPAPADVLAGWPSGLDAAPVDLGHG